MTLDSQTVEGGISIFKQVGFPAIVACWFMFRTDARLDKLTEAVNALHLNPPPLEKKK